MTDLAPQLGLSQTEASNDDPNKPDERTLVRVAVRMVQVKRVQPSLVVIEGVVCQAEAGLLKTGKSCLVNVRKTDNIHRILSAMTSRNILQTNASRWTQLPADEALVLSFQVDISSHAMERNRKGAVMLECYNILSIHEYREEQDECDWNNDDDERVLNSKSERHYIFASWLVDTYGLALLSSGTGVLDVAGGNGKLSAALLGLGVRAVILLDPKPRLSPADSPEKHGHRLKVVTEALYHDGSHLTSRKDTVAEAIRHCSIVVGMHPDSATEPIIDLSQRLGIPFALLPCCVMPSLFPHRRQKSNSEMPVRSYRTFCQYLLDKAPEGETYQQDHLPFVGRNMVIYSNKTSR